MYPGFDRQADPLRANTGLHDNGRKVKRSGSRQDF